MFNRIVNRFRLSQAAVLVQSTLEQIDNATLTIEPALIANRITAIVANQRPTLFDGSRGIRASRFSIAALALGQGVVEYVDDGATQLCCMLALGTILLEIPRLLPLYKRNEIDYFFLKSANQVYSEEAAKTEAELTEWGFDTV